jgi:hypothetical protein
MIDMQEIEDALVAFNLGNRHTAHLQFPRWIVPKLLEIRRNGLSTVKFPMTRRILEHLGDLHRVQRPSLNLRPSRGDWDGLYGRP